MPFYLVGGNAYLFVLNVGNESNFVSSELKAYQLCDIKIIFIFQ